MNRNAGVDWVAGRDITLSHAWRPLVMVLVPFPNIVIQTAGTLNYLGTELQYLPMDSTVCALQC